MGNVKAKRPPNGGLFGQISGSAGQGNRLGNGQFSRAGQAKEGLTYSASYPKGVSSNPVSWYLKGGKTSRIGSQEAGQPAYRGQARAHYALVSSDCFIIFAPKEKMIL